MNAFGLSSILAQGGGFGDDGGAGAAGAAAAAGVTMVILFVELVLIVLMIAGMWKVFVKAGKPGWAAIIPIYNVVVMLEIIGRPIWMVLLFLVPCVSIVVAIIVAMDMAKAFGRGAGFGVGLAFLPFIFYPMLGFGNDKYLGPVAS